MKEDTAQIYKVILFNPLTACNYIHVCPQAGIDLKSCLDWGKSGRRKCLGNEIFDAGTKRGLSVESILNPEGLENYEDQLKVLSQSV